MLQANLIPPTEAVMPTDPNSPVVGHIRDAMVERGRITYEQFVDISMHSRAPLSSEGSVLAHGDGYYASGFAEVGGSYGPHDFVTHTATPAFGMSIAHWVYDAWRKTGAPSSAMVVEMGAGNGAQAKSFIDEVGRQADLADPHEPGSFADFRQAMGYTILEYGAGMIRRQQERLAGYGALWVYGSAVDLPVGPKPAEGQAPGGLYLISNELPDTFPSARIVKEGYGFSAQLREVYVRMDGQGAFYEELGPLSSEELEDQANKADKRQPMQSGAERIFNLRAQRWAKGMSHALKGRKGGVLVIDYGEPSYVMDLPPRIYHRTVSAPYTTVAGARRMHRLQYELPGEVDITTSIAFSAIDNVLQAGGLRPEHAIAEPAFLGKYGFGHHVEHLAGQQEADPDPIIRAEYDALFPHDPDGYAAYFAKRTKAMVFGRRPRSFMAYSYLTK